MAKDMDYFMTEMHKISQDYIKKCGNPRANKMNKYAMAEEIIEQLGPITQEGHNNEEIMRNIKTTFEYST